ncbi:unnamed protein product [Mytilus coruscus]|uniref:Uncharacterized protein n=1 Tax=Mytilus coruscus TaxID=42192 RepID=A0A6J8CF63_MYTCO|nr:unnamed protein product [Mytilus coruscus]
MRMSSYHGKFYIHIDNVTLKDFKKKAVFEMTFYLHFRDICFLLTFLSYASGFSINEYSNPTGYTHENITRGALDRVASIYIATILKPGRFDLQNQTTREILKQYFDEVKSASKIYDLAVDDIVRGLENAQGKVRTSAKYSMNNEMITEGNIYLNAKRSQVEILSRDSSPDWSVVRMVVGDYLYTLQDFYSNTNWVELGGGTLNSLGWNDTLGIPVAADNQATCRSCHAFNGTLNGTCHGNIIARHVLTSGYIDHSETATGGVKVYNSMWANGEGKCSHGGRYDASRFLPATGGINKETSSTVLSPHYYLHSKAGKIATDATTEFFIRNASKTTYRVSKDGEEVKRWLNALTVDGGGDCPEYAMSGIKTAMQHARNGSCVFFFTDADPKDPELRNDVVNLIRTKNLHLVSFITGQCDGELLQSSTSKNGTPTVEEDHLDVLLNLKKNMAITYVNIYTTSVSSRSLNITVDSHISAFTVEIKGASSKPSSALYRPIGTIETFSGKSSFNDIGRSTYIMSIVSPVPGIWMLKNMNSETWTVTVKQQGDIEFTYQFLEDVHGSLLSIHGTPLAGSALTLLVKVTDLSPSDSLVYGILLDEMGTEITRMRLAQSSQGRKRKGIATFNVPNQAFKIAIEGTEKGNVFRRQSKELIHPASVSLQILKSDGNLYIDKDTTVICNVTNKGSTDETYQVQFTDTAGFTDSTVPATVRAGIILTTSLLLGGKEIQQLQTVFMVQPKIPPTIIINYKSSVCIPSVLNYFNCSKEFINITATVETSSLNLYYTKPRLDLKMSNSSGKYVLSFSGTCCSPKFSWFVSDSDSQVTEKHFDFTNGHSFSTVIPVKTSHLTEVTKTSNYKAVYYGIGGAVAACVITVAIILVIVKANGKAASKVSNTKMTDLSEDVVENPRPRMPRSHLQQFHKK